MKKKLADILAALDIAMEGAEALLTDLEQGILTEAEAKADLAEICSNLKNAIL